MNSKDFILSDSRILFKRIRDVALRHGKSPKYKAWLKAKNQSKDFHHVLGSVFGRKSTDLLAVLVDREDHTVNQDNTDWLIEQIPEAIENLLEYVEHLESDTCKG